MLNMSANFLQETYLKRSLKLVFKDIYIIYIYIYILYIYIYIYIRFGTEDYTGRLDIVQTLRELWQFFLFDFLGSKFANTSKPKILLRCMLQVLNNWFK